MEGQHISTLRLVGENVLLCIFIAALPLSLEEVEFLS